MSDRISQAFGHPIERAEALAGAEPRDRISLRDYVTEVEIGAFQQERGLRQRLRFNVVVEVQSASAPLADDVDRVLSYDRVTEAIEAELTTERLNLLETLAERVAHRILHEPRAERVFVRIEKLDRGPGALGVEIMRSRADAQPLAEEEAEEAQHAPRVVYLSNADVTAPGLPAALDRLQAAGLPTILCCGPAELASPRSRVDLAQRRIDLLAIEQNAWVLAGQDARCVVVNTRTELDWAMKHAQVSVWAPSKMVLDAVEGPARDAGPVELAYWLAGELSAERFVLLDPDAPLPEGETPAAHGDLETLA
ncbi:dihydroneopterin aldolase [Pseudooceanicola batsensis]|uniref:dihydroneopterin aldolase n=1 Tax=Pseudooceanicola batsensis TaxID=314255 RepID=UPI000314BFD6|nr:dihydroneopterin aldolase [Pseudooceanicola batsensis]